jgi:glucose/arabinose dehydrogenase
VKRTSKNPPSGRRVIAALVFVALLPTIGCKDAFVFCSSPDPVTQVGLELIADGFVAPVGFAVPGDGSGRLFILEQLGQIIIIDASGNRLATPFLDLSAKMVTVGIDFGNGVVFDERGLIGLVFHPNYRNNGLFYVFYTVPKDADDPADFDSQNLVSEFRVSAGDPNVADPASERVLLEINKPQFNHNGGQLAFGPDEYLYVGVGDGGAADDSGVGHNPDIGNGQDKMTFLGKLLRIDVNSGDPYAIPPDNPFVGDAGALPEIYALGMRNPWRFSFDNLGRLFVADVGQNLFEEINIVTIGGNYGWRIREGQHCFDVTDPNTIPPDTCPMTDADGAPLIDPILEYPHTADVQPFGISVTGGFLYRGRAIPCLRDEYIFGDWSTNFVDPDGSLYAAREADDGTWSMRELAIAGNVDGRIVRFITSFGQDEDCELYICTSQRLGPTDMTGEVYKIVSAP